MDHRNLYSVSPSRGVLRAPRCPKECCGERPDFRAVGGCEVCVMCCPCGRCLSEASTALNTEPCSFEDRR